MKNKNSAKMNNNLKITGFRINHRYENTGRSELYMTNYRIDENGAVHWLQSSGGSDGQREIASVHRNDINKHHNRNSGFLYPDNPGEEVWPSLTNAAFFATYERDWYSSNKNLGSICFNGTVLYLSGKRKHFTDWYSFNPNLADNFVYCNNGLNTILESEIHFPSNRSGGTNYYYELNKGYLYFRWK